MDLPAQFWEVLSWTCLLVCLIPGYFWEVFVGEAKYRRTSQSLSSPSNQNAPKCGTERTRGSVAAVGASMKIVYRKVQITFLAKLQEHDSDEALEL